MFRTRIIMGMPISIEIADAHVDQAAFDAAFTYFEYVDATFSPFKFDSELSKINRGTLALAQASADMQEIFALAEETKLQTGGYFDIRTPQGMWDPSGIVKGWAIENVSELLASRGFVHTYVDAGGDIRTRGLAEGVRPWKIGIQNPFNLQEVVKHLFVTDAGVATSGTYIRGNHIYNPRANGKPANEIVSLTVVGPTIYDADRFATAAFAMGKEGIYFIESLDGYEGYAIDAAGVATMTSHFSTYARDPVLSAVVA